MGVIREYAGKTPRFGARVYLAETAAIIGDVVLGDDVSVWYNSVVRGDCHFIRIGDRTNIQDNCAIHVTQGTYPTVLEEEVTLGHGGRHLRDHHGRGAGADDRAADVRDRRRARGDHGADVHVSDASGGWHGAIVS